MRKENNKKTVRIFLKDGSILELPLGVYCPVCGQGPFKHACGAMCVNGKCTVLNHCKPKCTCGLPDNEPCKVHGDKSLAHDIVRGREMGAGADADIELTLILTMEFAGDAIAQKAILARV